MVLYCSVQIAVLTHYYRCYIIQGSSQARLSRKRSHPSDLADGVASDEGSPSKHIKVNDEGYHSGTTAVVCVLSGEELVVANAGDSRCVLCSKGDTILACLSSRCYS